MPDSGWPASVVPANGCPHYVTRSWALRWMERHGRIPVACRMCAWRPVVPTRMGRVGARHKA